MIVIILAAAGVFLRCFKLSFQSYWFDEINSIEHVSQNVFFKWIAHGSGGDPPLYEFLLYFWLRIFGSHETPVRALSAIFSIGTIPALYALTRELFDRRTAGYSVILLSLSSYHIFYAQEARMYALTGFLVIISAVFFIKALKHGRVMWWALYALTAALAFYAHYAVLFIIFAEYATLCLFRHTCKIRLWYWLGSASAIAIMILPWIGRSVIPCFITPVFINRDAYLWVPPPSPKIIIDTFIFFIAGHEWVLRALPRGFDVACKTAVTATGSMILADLWLTFKQTGPRAEKAHAALLVVWCLLPVAAVYTVSVLLKPIYVVRYVDTALLALLVLCARAICRMRAGYLVISFFIFYAILNIMTLNHYYRFQVKSPGREIADHLRSKQLADKYILIHSPYEMRVIGYYYPGISHAIRELTPQSFRNAIKHNRDLVFVVPLDNFRAPDGIEHDLTERYQQTGRDVLGPVQIIVFSKVSSP
ncbi:MAG: glycosyltransferase family 39 protein [Candidatus Omnitrophica bacterium]|nr:glycosyltransferase family 39 protein [Candidatus Omnitrophota bacterium]